MASPMPVIFFGHGNPMNAIQQNVYTEAWRRIARTIPRPRAILCVSAHWYVPGVFVTAAAAPRTIHDFGGFPQELYEVRYPAPGDPALAIRIQELLTPLPVGLDQEWGLDHGTWSVLCHVYPAADIPVVQLSIDETKPAAFHYELGRRLTALRDEGVLIVGSGNLIHNLRAYAWDRRPVQPLEWAVRFETGVRKLLLTGKHAPLITYAEWGQDAMLAAPTPDHYLPLLYVIALQRENEAISFPVEGFEGGSISMLSVQIGGYFRELTDSGENGGGGRRLQVVYSLVSRLLISSRSPSTTSILVFYLCECRLGPSLEIRGGISVCFVRNAKDRFYLVLIEATAPRRS